MSFLIDIGFVIGPLLGFIPQIFKNEPKYNPGLSLLTIFSVILKLLSNEKNIFDPVLIYQLLVLGHIHIYMLRMHSKMKDLERYNFQGIIITSNFYYKHLIKLVVVFFVFLKILSAFGLSYLFSTFSTAIDVTITFFHLNLYATQASKPVELFLFWIVGDFVRIYFLITRYSAPIIMTLSVVAQIIVNLIIVFR